ncbi:WG repeat-containing protein [Pasteurella atlantica]|uniref:WG repeat-containing protein n=2 Tax=Pasteurellaceae TaxID=712 RepID=A0ACC6HKG4_9PAST|nr:WG repeat-containing protein [Pasteurella atlantica]MDP8051324.1 WG repeat-containing protein [Pasteurella atlantica]MDP8100321.1 WG repeat-containing protein [Pasteurella atlantica]MDP8104619.1 WG repeat-containing protein [Pasteurella atlantica]MDP8147828.1 WG repeat-containing protein [Pasteurella atlantica]
MMKKLTLSMIAVLGLLHNANANINGLLGFCLKDTAQQLKCGLMDNKANLVVAPELDYIAPFPSKKMPFIPHRYAYKEYFDDNGFTTAHKNGKSGIINTKGQWVINPQFEIIGEFAKNGLAFATKNDLYGYINTKGEWVIPPRFKRVSDFSANGLARMEEKGKYGFIDKRGKWVIPPQFWFAEDFGDYDVTPAKERENGLYGLIDRRGQWVVQPQYRYIGAFNEESLAEVYTKDGKFAYINKKGKIVTALFDSQTIFYEGLAERTKDNWGMLNTKGEWVIPPEFDYIHNSYNGYVIVEKNDKYGAFDRKGKLVIPLTLEWIQSFSNNGLAEAKKNTKYGYINTKGEWVIKPQFDETHFFDSNGLAKVVYDGKYGYINEKGKFIVPAKFGYLHPFNKNGLALAMPYISTITFLLNPRSRKYGFIDTKGQWIIKPEFEVASEFYPNGLAVVRENGQYGYINEKGDYVAKIMTTKCGAEQLVTSSGKPIYPKMSVEELCK